MVFATSFLINTSSCNIVFLGLLIHLAPWSGVWSDFRGF
jgi:hypothetical protein